MIIETEHDVTRSGTRVIAAVVVAAFALGGIGGYAVSSASRPQAVPAPNRVESAVSPARPQVPGLIDATAVIRRSANAGDGEMALRELNRRIATCDDPFGFLDQRDYCLGVGPWQSSSPTRLESGQSSGSR